MAIIYSYPPNNNILSTDIIVCTSTALVGGKPKNQTKSLSIGNLTAFITTSPSNNLNQVLTNGNTSELDAKIGELYLYDSPNGEYAKIAINDSYFTISRPQGALTPMLSTENGDNLILTNGNGFAAQILNNLLVSRSYTLPNASGTFALTSNLLGYVPYTGATGPVNLGAFNLTANSVTTTIDSIISGLTIGRGSGNLATNTVVGNSTLSANVTGTQITAIGNLALNSNTANNNTAVGFKAMLTNTTGNTNTSVGSESLQASLSGNENSAFGYRTLYLATSANRNNAFGRTALGNILTGSQNIGIGFNAGSFTTAGNQNTTSDFSIYIGNDTKPSLDNNQNEIVIGYNANGLGSNTVVLGNGSILTTILRGQTLIGTTTAGSPSFGLTPQLVVSGVFTGTPGSGFGVVDLRSSSTSIVANDLLGRLQFSGKDDSAVGYVTAAIDAISAGTAGGGNGGGGILKFMTAANAAGSSLIEKMRITDTNVVQPGTDNSYSLGASGIRWSAVWAANGTIQTSDKREKKDIVDSDLGLDFISKLRPVSFKWKVGKNEVTNELDGLDEEGNPKTKIVVTPIEGKRTHYGLIAQEVEAALDGKDFGGFIHDKETDIKGLRYDQLIPVMINAIKELKAEIEILKAK